MIRATLSARALGAVLLALLLPVAAFAGEGAQRLERYLAGLDSLRADFVQYTFNAARTQMTESHGRFYLQRPGRFRWEYDDPVAQVIIADGKRVYVHDLELEQVTHQSQERALRGTPALLLASGAPITEHFAVSELPSTDGRAWVALRPLDADAEVERIELGFGSDGLESLIMEDGFGQNTRLDFSAATRNLALEPDLFEIDRSAVDDFLSFD
ncbi:MULTISPECIES: outer membrane lipoprotein chaperone LolA [Marichromatium]|uniref:Outer-membrane lipoprotein carrier protein n=1 Tax=Marichromatium gracile TaxID=1048 RepID=A0A4R4A5T2_MARGR|nr:MULTISPECIES: outer membrane lipoprotein chaperone LolA [Marichromatium]MBK1710033.1 outer membrane lipoprotein carrier protein LolA [Marichromatium gracile]RNE91283.1 outer membrane lipoprotein carrier protein LolA [Marichromatium sp. AB31]RNE92552.1 outer membrane lipoprotein carrier protein LolA [Marichromatium sp. AB32]TCW33263.1 outer membrane lipoprotein carrier protein [Marichromatium gracile]